jgi:peptidoglycan hydrolase-like protein with peptidoglycan-binding domain
MPKKTIIIFITVFIIVGAIIFGVMSWLNKSKTTTNTTTPWYQNFNPFGAGGNNPTNNTNTNTGNNQNQTQPGTTPTSKFYQITDFAVSGATFLNDTRPIVNTNTDTTPQPEQIKTIIPANTQDGRKEIQNILNTTLSLNPPLKIDGNFGKSATEAIKKFQKLNNLTVTGIVDANTAPYFTKTTQASDLAPKSQFEQAPSVRFAERMNGHIYKMFLDTKVKEEISNSTIPSIYEAHFDSTAQTVIYRYLSVDKIINSFIATLGAAKGEFLPQNISDLSTSLDKTKFFYITENSSGATGTIGTFGDTKRDIIFNSPFTEWLSQWDANGRVYLTTKASYSVNGSMFQLDATKKTINKIFGGVQGLTTLISPNGSSVLYSSSTNTGPRLGIFNIAKHTTNDLNSYGLPEKCVWSNDSTSIYCAIPSVITGNQYPDSWYQGLTSFTDYFVKFNAITGEKTTIANEADKIQVDGTNLFLNDKEDLLFFINKKDSTLWNLSLK